MSKKFSLSVFFIESEHETQLLHPFTRLRSIIIELFFFFVFLVIDRNSQGNLDAKLFWIQTFLGLLYG